MTATLTRFATNTTVEHDITVTLPSGDEFSFESPQIPPSYADVYVDTDGDNVIVRWLEDDMDGFDHAAPEWDDPDTDPEQWCNGVFRDFRNQHDGGGESARDEFVAEMVERFGSERVFIVDVYAHGLEHFSRRDTANYPDRRWDVAPACVLVVPSDVTDPEAWADGMLETWTDCVNGSIYGCIELVVSPDGEVTDDGTVWGLVGHKWAEQCLTEGY